MIERVRDVEKEIQAATSDHGAASYAARCGVSRPASGSRKRPGRREIVPNARLRRRIEVEIEVVWRGWISRRRVAIRKMVRKVQGDERCVDEGGGQRRGQHVQGLG